MRVLYIHGFNSSPESQKARIIARHCRQLQPPPSIQIPALPPDPDAAIALLESLVREHEPNLLVGSSLGGYYATWLAERHGLKAVLINPAVSPWRHLAREFLGRHRNPHSGEEFEITPAHLESLRRLDVEQPSRPENFLLLAQTGDEVLDYRLAVERYAGAWQIIQEGGNHAFEDFEAMLPQIFAFATEDGDAPEIRS